MYNLVRIYSYIDALPSRLVHWIFSAVVLFLRFLEIWITHDSMVQINVECCVFVLLGRVIVSFMWNWDSMVQIIVECCVFVLLGRVIVSFMWNWDHSLTFSADGGDPKNKKKTI
jgi:hypothetical protein